MEIFDICDEAFLTWGLGKAYFHTKHEHQNKWNGGMKKPEHRKNKIKQSRSVT